MKTLVENLSPARREQIMAAIADVIPLVLPPGWVLGESHPNAAWFLSRQGLRVLVEVEEQDASLWLHMSVSRKDRMPSYQDIVDAKEFFLGPERRAIQVFPKRSEHFSFHPFCLHLYSPLERDPFPADFRMPTGEL